MCLFKYISYYLFRHFLNSDYIALVYNKRGTMKAKEENRKKVIRLAMRNPTMSLKDMSEKLGIPKPSVQKYLREYRESDDKDPRVVGITNRDLEIISKWQEIIAAKLDNDEEIKKMTALQVSQVTSESAKRYSLLRWVQNQESQGNVNNQAIQVNILFGWQKEEWQMP